MEKNRTKLLLMTLLVIAAGVYMTACKKSPDPQPVPDYTATVVFWQTAATRDKYRNNGLAYYEYYLDGIHVGEMYYDHYWNLAPNCGATDAVTATYKLKTSTEKKVPLEVRDNVGNILFDDSVVFKADQCTKYEIK